MIKEKTIYEKYGKRLLDCILSIIAVIVMSPIMIIISILVRFKLGSPVLFTQNRPGKNGKVFKMYKFRTMTNEKDKNGELLSDDVRLTSFGKKLRSTSLDELPELFNILKGDMSIVGPRPQLVRDMVFMTEEQNRRHSVRQGLTGLAQVNGRNNIGWEEKLEYDIDYIENITFRNDIKIILKTICKVIKKEDIATNGMETAEDYGDYLLRTNKIDMNTYDKLQKKAKELLKHEIVE